MKTTSDPRRIVVDLGPRSYPIVIGHGVRQELPDLLPEAVRRVAIVSQQRIADAGIEVHTGLEQRVFAIGDGEEHKVMSTIESLCREWAEWGLNRNDVVIGLGGGVVTDVAGFAASVYHRGIAVVHVPTTLLGQIDAAIGGKTGINLPEGKNLVGTYWQPTAVVCDIETLDSLPERHFRAGLGELAKYHFLGGGRLDELDLVDRVAASASIKATAVAADEREGGSRALLNYGHTLAHALETAGNHSLLHGEAVAIGLVYAAEVAKLLDRIDADQVAEHRRVVSGYDLPIAPPAELNFDELRPLFGRDKKALTDTTFVLDGPGGPEVVSGVDDRVLAEAYRRLSR